MWYKVGLTAAAGLLERYYSHYCTHAEALILRNSHEKVESASEEIVVLNHNVNHEMWRGGMSRKRRDYILSTIGEMEPQPDIITLQEVYRSAIPVVQSVLGDSVVEFSSHFSEYNAVFGHSGGIGHLGLELGKLTLSRYPILRAEKKQIEKSYVRSILWTKLDTPVMPTNVYNVHITGLQSQLREVLSYVEVTAGKKERIVIAGDLNLDISLGSSSRGILEDAGFKVSDVGKTALVGIRVERARHWRSIDMIAVKDEDGASSPVFDRVLDAFSSDDGFWPSDHAGIRAKLSCRIP